MESTSVKLHILRSGLLTLVQDLGRTGYEAYGLPRGGALDRQAARMANHLVGLPEDAPVLEITLQGPEIRFDGDLQIALTGADLQATLDGQTVKSYQTLAVKKGQVLGFGRPNAGCRAYLAVRGRWQLPEWLGSYSGLKVSGAYWPKGSHLERGKAIMISPLEPITPRKIPKKDRPYHSHQLTVRIVAGPEFSWFPERAIRHLTTHIFSVGPDSNRMGYRLRESLPGTGIGRELISSGIIPGTIQILPSGRPVILLADAQTTGGYPRIANVLSQDLDFLAQLVPGDKVRFRMT